MDTFFSDLRYSARKLLRAPGFTAAAVLTLAIGIGANVAIFSVIESALLRPPSYRDPDRVVMLGFRIARPAEARVDTMMFWSYPKYETLRRVASSYERLAGFASESFNLTGAGEPERLSTEVVSADYFPLLGASAFLGRTFSPEEDRTPRTHPVVILSHGLWQRRFGSDRRVIGSTIALNKTALTIVGVMPPGFTGLTGRVDAWIPMAFFPALSYPQALEESWAHWFSVVGRLRRDVTPAQMQGEMPALTRSLAEALPKPFDSPDEWSNVAVPLREARVDTLVRTSVFVLFGAVGFVLLIACVNIANLLLARAAARRREMAVRTALGASRWRLARQVLTESVVLALAGGLLGVVLATWGIGALERLNPATVGNPMRAPVAPLFDLQALAFNPTVLLFAVALSLFSGLVFGVFPAIAGTRGDLTAMIKDGAAASSRGFGRRGIPGARSLLVVGEIALALVLLIGAGLLLRSFSRLRGVELGFDPSHLLTLRIDPPETQYTYEDGPSLHARLLERIAAVPGVLHVAVNRCAPLSSRCNATLVHRVDERHYERQSGPLIGVHYISPDYLATLRIPLLRGRTYTAQDRAGTRKMVLLNETAARTLWPGQDPVGKRISLGMYTGDELAEVIGIVGDARYGAADAPIGLDAYAPALQQNSPRATLFVRTAGDPAAITAAVRAAVREVDADLPIFDVKTMDERIGDALSRARFGALLLTLFAAVALILASIGIYGVMAYGVAQRTREIGIRIALGAEGRRVLGMVLRQGMGLALAGLAVGVASALALTRVLRSLLFEISTTDPWIFGGIVLLLGAIALLATYLPARRATRVDPMVALRSE